MDFKSIIEMQEAMTPKTGYNVVGVDDFDIEHPLYLIGFYTTREEAEAEVERQEKDHSDPVYIYTNEK